MHPSLVILLAVLGLTAGCDHLPVHRLDIRQGNALEQDQVAQLKRGMTPEQVKYLLGEPIIQDPFHADRWDYLYYFKPADRPVERQRLTVYFEAGHVTDIRHTPQEVAQGTATRSP